MADWPQEVTKNETPATSDEEKRSSKENRQQLKLSCLSMANNLQKTAEQIVSDAKAFYAFVRT